MSAKGITAIYNGGLTSGTGKGSVMMGKVRNFSDVTGQLKKSIMSSDSSQGKGRKRKSGGKRRR
jgi:hypothetical protein